MGQNKLSKYDAQQLRYEYAGGSTVEQLIDKYHISKTLCYDIINNSAKAYAEPTYIPLEVKQELVAKIREILGVLDQ